MSGRAPLGLFGGTFDPIHLGHLRLAEEAQEFLGLETVRFVPAGQPPHRAGPGVAAAERLAMVCLATRDNPAFAVDPSEVESDEPSYTVPTLERLRREFGSARPIVLLLGADAFSALPTWHRWHDLLELAHIAVVHRGGKAPVAAELPAELVQACITRHAEDPAALRESPAGCVLAVPMTPLAISATDIRARLAARRSVRYLLPPEVLDYIRSRRLYA
ncbi:MAG TPA: nicotinate-nucleotide adenylyltransferase [Rhodocyclaceae bacterium]